MGNQPVLQAQKELRKYGIDIGKKCNVKVLYYKLLQNILCPALHTSQQT